MEHIRSLSSRYGQPLSVTTGVNAELTEIYLIRTYVNSCEDIATKKTIIPTNVDRYACVLAASKVTYFVLNKY